MNDKLKLLEVTTIQLNFAKLLLLFLANYSLIQMVDFPTRLTNILDLFITNMPSVVLSCKPLPGISDHEIVFVELFTNIELQNSTRTCKLWHKADIISIHEVITNFNNEFLHCNADTPVDAL